MAQFQFLQKVDHIGGNSKIFFSEISNARRKVPNGAGLFSVLSPRCSHGWSQMSGQCDGYSVNKACVGVASYIYMFLLLPILSLWVYWRWWGKEPGKEDLWLPHLGVQHLQPLDGTLL
jgi:hypothetical protein